MTYTMCLLQEPKSVKRGHVEHLLEVLGLQVRNHITLRPMPFALLSDAACLVPIPEIYPENVLIEG